MNLLLFTGLQASPILVDATVARHRSTHVELEVARFISWLGFVAPDLLTLPLHGWTLAIEAIALASTALNQILDVEVGWALARAPSTELG